VVHRFCKEVTDLSLSTIGKVCPLLQSLSIDNHSHEGKLTHIAVVDACVKCSQLTELHCSNISFTVSSLLTLISKCPQLIIIDIPSSSCADITVQDLCAFSAHCPSVTQFLVVDQPELICDELLESLAKNCKMLKSSWNVESFAKNNKAAKIHPLAISDSGLTTFVTGCRLLTRLDLSSAVHLTQTSFSAIASSLSRLEYFFVTHNAHFSDTSLQLLSSHCIELRWLRVKACPQVTSQGLRLVITACRRLDCLEVSADMISEEEKREWEQTAAGVEICIHE
jgi:hypothetical protein